MISAAAVAVLTLCGCPQQPQPPPPSASSGEPQGTDGDPTPIPGNVCDHLDGGLDDTAGAIEECPDATDDAIRIEWNPYLVTRRTARSVAFFETKNLLQQEVVVEYEATARMVDSDEVLSIPFSRPPQMVRPLSGYLTGMDLQFGVELDVLDEGQIELAVSARLVRPVETEMTEMSRVIVATKLDEDGLIYDIDLVDR